MRLIPLLLLLLVLVAVAVAQESGYIGAPPQRVVMLSSTLLINSMYAVNTETCEDRLLYADLGSGILKLKLVIPKAYYETQYEYSCPGTPVFYFEERYNRIVLTKIECANTVHDVNIVMCETRACHFIIYHDHERDGEIQVDYPAPCYGETPSRQCSWWDIGCHILNALRAIWDWLVNAIMSILPQWLKDLAAFATGLATLVIAIIAKLAEVAVYFIFTIMLFMTLGMVYYTIEHGVAGLGKFFHDLYEILRKIVSFMLQIIETILP